MISFSSFLMKMLAYEGAIFVPIAVPLILRPHVEALPSHLKDTTDYLQKMESMNPLPSGTILVSMDVTSLYTNIPHNDGIEAFVPIAVPLICKKCSPLNVKLLCFSTNVSNWTRHSVGGSLTALLVSLHR
jgi:hypothetical protein